MESCQHCLNSFGKLFRNDYKRHHFLLPTMRTLHAAQLHHVDTKLMNQGQPSYQVGYNESTTTTVVVHKFFGVQYSFLHLPRRKPDFYQGDHTKLMNRCQPSNQVGYNERTATIEPHRSQFLFISWLFTRGTYLN